MFRALGVACAVALAASAVVGPAVADSPPRARSACAFVSQIYDFKAIDDYTAIIRTSPSRSFKVTFANSCREMKWALFARVEARPGVCLTAGDKIIVGRNGFFDRCFIRTVEALPPKSRDTAAAAPY
jgi:hypothetical protein